MKQNQTLLKKIKALEDAYRLNKKKIADNIRILENSKNCMSSQQIRGKESLIRSLENQNYSLRREIERLHNKVRND